MRIEQGFRAVERGQWRWQRTRTADPARVGRLWAAIALTTLWGVEAGDEGEPAEVPPVPAAPKSLSLLREGLLRLIAALLSRKPLPIGRIGTTIGRPGRGNQSR